MRRVLLLIACSASVALAQPVAPSTPQQEVKEKPAVTLPEVPAANVEEVNKLLDQVGQEQGEEQIYSYGKSPHSLLFTSEQITAMKNVLQKVEARKASGSSEELSDSDLGREALLPFLKGDETSAATGEPSTYPVFYLSSIAYRNANDWAVWMGRTRITPKNNKPPLEITGINGDSASFRWTPEYFAQLIGRKQAGELASMDGLKHRTTKADSVNVLAEPRAITFTLRPNQSFSSAHMRTFEGKVAAVSLGESAPILPSEAGQKPVVPVSDAEAALLEDMAGGAVHGGPPANAGDDAVEEKAVKAVQQLIQQQKALHSSPLVTKPDSAGTPQTTP